MSVALEEVREGDWDGLRRNQETVQRNLRQPTPNARVRRNAAAQVITNATLTAITFDTEVWDVGNLWKVGTPTRLTASVTGLWVVGANVQFQVSAVGQRQIRLVQNAALNFTVKNQMTNTDGNQPILDTYGFTRMVAGDYVELYVYQNSGGNLNVEGGADYTAVLWMYRLGGYTNEGIA